MRRRSALIGFLAAPLLACNGNNNNNNNNGDLCEGVSPVAGTALSLRQVASGLDTPVYLTAPPGDTARLFVIEQPGRIRIIKNDQLLGAPFLDINGRVGFDQNERGLFSVAFHPNFAQNGRLFVNYTDNNGDIIVSEFASAPGADTADPGSEQQLLFIEHSQLGNHNGGTVKFGPDGLLYISVGDGGGAGDPFAAGQDPTLLLGKLLRIDVDGAAQVPADNPFGNEVFQLGLRNPWRYSFDRETGDLYIGDVGQDAFEEIDFAAAGAQRGVNWGWSSMEGDGHCFNDINCLNDPAITRPITEYAHADDPNVCSVIGGYSYRGCAMPDLHGTYFFADACAGFIKSLKVVDGAATEEQDRSAELSGGVSAIVSFGEDARGELYAVSRNGQIFQIVPAGQ